MRFFAKIFFFVIIINSNSFAQNTYIPDDAFEQKLINLDLDFVFDDSVSTAAIDTVTWLYVYNSGISDLTGIEDFISLSHLFCYDNNIDTLDLSNNINLVELNCNNNSLKYLDISNGNNIYLFAFQALNNDSLMCINVDDVWWANSYCANWLKDPQCVFSDNCFPTSIKLIDNINTTKEISKIIDLFGREISLFDIKSMSPFLVIYGDGTIEKKIIIK